LLIDKIKQGDLNSFEQLVARYEAKVFTIAYRYTGNHHDAGDLAQEAFIRVYRAIGSFRGESSFLTWLYRVVTNVCKDEMRRRSRENTVSIDEMTEWGKQPVPRIKTGPLETVLHKEWQEEIQQVLNSLSYEHRTVIVMRDIQGYTYEEIAFFLECSLGTVKSRLSRARNILKDLLLARSDILSGIACGGQ
jgi:RNA polymerase sigma-70 factor (ECF subfamily)